MFVSALTLPLLVALAGCSDKAGDSAVPETGLSPRSELLDFDGEPPSNLIILSVDTLRRDALGRYGGSLTPNLDRLLAEGVALDDHRSCSNWTYASMLCVLSGKTTDQLGFEPLHKPSGEPAPLTAGFTLLGHLLDERGMTGAVVSTNVFLSDTFHTTAGYTYETYDGELDAAGVVDAGLALQEQLPGDRWLLHLHFLDPHDPYDTPPAYQQALDGLPPLGWDLTDLISLNELRGALPELDEETRALVDAHLRARYDGLTRYVDDEIGRFLEAMEERGALDDALVVVLTDHGEQLLDHGDIGHGLTLFDEETRAVAGFWSPSLTPAVWEGPTSHVDLLPTLAQALGWSVDIDFSGVPIGGEARPILVHRYSREETLQSVVFEDQKLVYDWQSGYALYDLSDDPGEQLDRADDDPASVERLRGYLEPQTAALLELYPDYTPDYPPEGS